MKNLPLVSIIIPCRNEEKFIGQCLDSIIANDYPEDKFEVLVVDGMSEDRTREIMERYVQQYRFIRLLDNQKRITPVAMNIGIKNSMSELIVFMGAHATYKKDYISKCVKYLQEYGADNVGGVLRTVPKENTLLAKAIALCLSDTFGAGNAYFRTGSKKTKWVDTVFGGCYKREIFDRIGFYNENLVRSQDIEFNLRLKKAGGKILLVPDIVSYYYPKSSIKEFFFQNFKSGMWTILGLRFVRAPLRARHYAPFIFISSLLVTGLLGIFSLTFFRLFLSVMGLYILASILFSVKIAMRRKDFRLLVLMPVVFTARHIGYGIGSIFGLLKMLIAKM